MVIGLISGMTLAQRKNLKSVYPTICSIAQRKNLLVSETFDALDICNIVVNINLNDWELDEFEHRIQIVNRPDSLIWKL